MKIANIDELTKVILSDQFSDEQMKQIIEKALVVLFVNDLPPRKELAELVRNYFYNFPNRYERPIFIDLPPDALEVEQ